jgi:hypothetical protein
MASVLARLLFCPQNRVLCDLSDSEFDDGLCWNLDLLLRFGIDAGASFPLLLYQLAKTRQDEFPVLLDRFVGEVAERIKEYSSGSFVGLTGCCKCDLKFSLGHLKPWFMAAESNDFKESRLLGFDCFAPHSNS